jgi:hypothetical protein
LIDSGYLWAKVSTWIRRLCFHNNTNNLITKLK